MPEMSTVHGASPVLLGSFVLRNEQHCEHAAPFLCRACQRCSLTNHNAPLWEVATPSEMGGKQAGGFSCCGFVQIVWYNAGQYRVSHRAPASPAPVSILSFWEAQKGRMYPVGKTRHWAPSPPPPDKPTVLARQIPPMWELHQQRWRCWGIREGKSFIEVHHSAASKAFKPSYESYRATGLPVP